MIPQKSPHAAMPSALPLALRSRPASYVKLIVVLLGKLKAAPFSLLLIVHIGRLGCVEVPWRCDGTCGCAGAAGGGRLQERAAADAERGGARGPAAGAGARHEGRRPPAAAAGAAAAAPRAPRELPQVPRGLRHVGGGGLAPANTPYASPMKCEK